MFCSCFELFISVGLQQTAGLPSLMPIFADDASLYSSCICSGSVIFVWSLKVVFSEKQSHIINFFRSYKMTLVITNAVAFANIVLDLPVDCAKFICVYYKFISLMPDDSLERKGSNENWKPVSALLPLPMQSVNPRHVCIVVLQHKGE